MKEIEENESVPFKGGYVMNNLNSILIEGEVEKIVEQTINESAFKTVFTIVSNRYVKGKKDYERKQIHVTIVTRDKLADSCNKQLKKKRGVRVVGILDEDEADGRLFVVAEHVEFRPEFKKS